MSVYVHAYAGVSVNLLSCLVLSGQNLVDAWRAFTTAGASCQRELTLLEAGLVGAMFAFYTLVSWLLQFASYTTMLLCYLTTRLLDYSTTLYSTNLRIYDYTTLRLYGFTTLRFYDSPTLLLSYSTTLLLYYSTAPLLYDSPTLRLSDPPTL